MDIIKFSLNSLLKQLFEFALIIKFLANVNATYQFALDVQLRIGRPFAVGL